MAPSITVQPLTEIRQPAEPPQESTSAITLSATAEMPTMEMPATHSPIRTMLVVDDQPSVRAAIAYYLETCGYRTFRAESGWQAIELFGKEHIDGILLDVQMPKLNGFETSARLHELARASNRQIKIWFMTGIYYRELKGDCAKAGGLAVFQKPFDWTQLLSELEQGLSASPLFTNPNADSAPNPT